MPISPIVLQRRHAELGRIRLGAKRNGNGAPMKLETFRFTSASERYIHDLAALYGGEARQWDNNGKPEWEVYTDAKVIPVIAVKGGLSQWMETWSGGGCTHRCDGEQQVDGTVCNPNDPDHQAAKPTTRLSVMLPELEAIGVWRMESHGWNSAAEIPAVAELAQFVGDLVPANLHLVERRSVKDGKTSRFVVPVLDLQIGTERLKEIVAAKSGEGPVAVAGSQERQAITSGPAPSVESESVQLPTLDDIRGANSRDAVTAIWRFLKSHDALTEELEAACADRVAEIEAPTAPAADTGSEDPDVVWQQVLAEAGRQGLSTDDLMADFEKRAGVPASEAGAGEMRAYLQQLQEGAAA